jgi:RHS repeat-associated protein
MGAYEYLNIAGPRFPSPLGRDSHLGPTLAGIPSRSPGDDLGDPEPPPAGSSAREPSGTPHTAFTYDALGRRIEKIVDSGGAQVEVTRYYYQDQNVILETDADEAPRRSFVHGSQYIDERVLMRLPDGKEYYYLPRELYSVAALTDESGAIVEAATYDTYGQVAVYDQSATAIPQSEVGNVYYFTGRRLDLLPTASSPQPAAKQLYHYRARAYDPENGRFGQRDDAYRDGKNLYEFGHSSPQVWVDPLGRANVPLWIAEEVGMELLQTVAGIIAEMGWDALKHWGMGFDVRHGLDVVCPSGKKHRRVKLTHYKVTHHQTKERLDPLTGNPHTSERNYLKISVKHHYYECMDPCYCGKMNMLWKKKSGEWYERVAAIDMGSWSEIEADPAGTWAHTVIHRDSLWLAEKIDTWQCAPREDWRVSYPR